jgi:hypothetical protein
MFDGFGSTTLIFDSTRIRSGVNVRWVRFDDDVDSRFEENKGWMFYGFDSTTLIFGSTMISASEG